MEGQTVLRSRLVDPFNYQKLLKLVAIIRGKTPIDDKKLIMDCEVTSTIAVRIQDPHFAVPGTSDICDKVLVNVVEQYVPTTNLTNLSLSTGNRERASRAEDCLHNVGGVLCGWMNSYDAQILQIYSLFLMMKK